MGCERLGMAAGSAVAGACVADGSFGVPADDADRARDDHSSCKPAGAIGDHVQVCNHWHRVQRVCSSEFLRAFMNDTSFELARYNKNRRTVGPPNPVPASLAVP